MNYSKSDIYRSKIHSLIPGGAHTYSKGDDQFPEIAPAAIRRGKGAYVWDLDGNKFMDCSMGLGSVTLGHAFDEVNDAICETIKDGVNFQRPSYLELETAEAFLSLVGYHDMIKFSKNGSTVTSAAVKLARAFTGRNLVGFPIDHPFYSYDDWFITAKECNKGIPDALKELTVTFKSNDISSLKALFEKYPNKIACIISEPEKFEGTSASYIKEVIDICHANGALFIADEMVTGFKAGFPGACNKFKVVPDLSTWGKGIANGYSFCALTGRKDIMELGGIKKKGAEKVFLISTTHGGETHAMAAVLKTIEIYKRENVVESIHRKGNSLIKKIRGVIAQNEMSEYLSCTDSAWTIAFGFNGKDKMPSMMGKTLFMQEMIKRGILFQGAFLPSFSHTDADLEIFVEKYTECLKIYKEALPKEFKGFLVGEECKPVFRRYI